MTLVLKLPKQCWSPSVASLLLANLVPLFGVVFLGWDVFLVLFTYMVECAVISAYNILKLIIVTKLAAFAYVPAFLIMFYSAMLVPFAIVGGLYDNQHLGQKAFEEFLGNLAYGAIGFGLSHGISFVVNFIGQKEYARMSAEDQLIAPFRRIFLVGAAAFLGAFLIILREIPLAFLIWILFLTLPFLVMATAARVVRFVRGEVRLLPPIVGPLRRLAGRFEKRHIKAALGALAVLAVLLVSPVVSMLILLVAMKTAADVHSHLKEHRAA